MRRPTSGRFFLRQLGGQIRAVDHRQHLALGHAVAGMHLERDRAQRVGIQGGADGRHDLAVGGDVAHEAAALHRGDRSAASDRRKRRRRNSAAGTTISTTERGRTAIAAGDA